MWPLNLPSSRGKSLCCPTCSLRSTGRGLAPMVPPLDPLHLCHSPLQRGPEQPPSGPPQPPLAPGVLPACCLSPPMAGGPCCLGLWPQLGKKIPHFLVSDFPLQFPAFVPGRSHWSTDSQHLPASVLWLVQGQGSCPKLGASSQSQVLWQAPVMSPPCSPFPGDSWGHRSLPHGAFCQGARGQLGPLRLPWCFLCQDPGWSGRQV